MELRKQMNPKPVQFNFGEYLNRGFEFFKNNLGDNIVAYLLVFVMSIIPFCGLLAVGNFYKYCRKIRKGEKAEVGEIFNFDDFVPYFILQLIMMAGIVVLYFGFGFLGVAGAMIQENTGGDVDSASPIFAITMIVFMFLFFIALVYFMAKAFYIPGLISLNGITDMGEAWRISKTMSKGNTLMIILFVFLTSFLGQLGIILCGIGIFLTIPMYYTMNYFAQEDGLSQISVNEVNEIGNSEY